MDKDDVKRRIESEEDYIRCPKFSNSLNKFVAKNDDGVPNGTIARLLLLPEEKVEEIYEEAVAKLREEMVDKEEE